MSELDKFCPPPILTVTPRQVERVTQLFWESANAASADLFQHMTSQLLALFRAQGCALPLAELAQKVTGELTAQVREVLRRPNLGASWISGAIQVGDLTLDLERHIFWRGVVEVHLSPKEFDLLALMMKNADVLLTHVKLLRSVWGPEYGGELEYLRTIIYALRKKIEKNPGKPEYIVSEPRIGYRFRSPAGVARRLGLWGPPHPDNQGNCASSTAMALAVVSRGAKHVGIAANGVGSKARRARRLRP
jgi:DNA-binding winged helix-turn-helix (wHTH) protein